MASRSLNKVTLIGNLTRDPELKYTPSGTAVCTFGVATNRSWTTADGSTKEEVQYHRIIAWQKLAELCGKILTKGRKVFLEGRLTYRSYTSKDGQQKSITEIVLDDFIVFSDGKKTAEVEVKPINKETVAANEEVKSKNNKEEIKNETEEKIDETVNPDDIPF